jgi:hypothetical protein
MRRARYLAVLLAALLVSPGCGRLDRLPTGATTPPPEGDASAQLDRTASDLQAQCAGNFYPIASGNRWRYADSGSKVYIPFEGSPSEKHWEGKTEVVQVRMEGLHGRSYMREEIGIPDTVLTGGGVRWRRQDRTGLYEFGPTAPGAQPYSETRLLAYPLHVGAKWAMFESSLLRDTATVEGIEVLRLPAGRFAAWRIRITGGSTEKIVWYGRAGYLGEKSHFESTRADAPGRIQIIYNDSESLTAIHLVRRSS